MCISSLDLINRENEIILFIEIKNLLYLTYKEKKLKKKERNQLYMTCALFQQKNNNK